MTSPLIAHIRSALDEARQSLERFTADDAALASIARAAESMAQSLRAGGRVIACGNGGSLCDAAHFAEELSGRFRRDRKALSAIALTDPAHLTCAANDFGYEAVFARGVEAHGRPGDMLLAISTSGRSPNIIKAANAARAAGMTVVALTGKHGSELGRVADIEITAPSSAFSDRVQEIHIKVIHTLVELIERQLFPELYQR